MNFFFSSCVLALALTASPQPAASPAASANKNDSSAVQHPGHGPEAGHDAHHHHGHAEEPPPTPEETARQNEMNSLSEKKLQALAAYLQALMDGKSDAEAVRKAGVPITELDKISFLSEHYYPARSQALRFEEELAALQASPSTPATASSSRRSQQVMLTRKLAAHERFRGQFFKNVSDASKALIDKYEPTFVQLVRAQEARRDSLRQEARQLAVKNFSDKCIPGFIAYLNARAANKSEREAIQASGLDEKMILGLSQLVSEYGARKLTAQKAAKVIPDVRARQAEKEKAGQSTSFEVRLIQYHQEQIAAFEPFRTKFAADNGEALTKAIDDNFDALMAGYTKHEKHKSLEQSGH